MLKRFREMPGRKLKHTGGFFLAVLGPDGSGKTTTAQAFSQVWKLHSYQIPIYIHGDFNVLPHLKSLRKIWAKITGRELPPDTDYTQKHAGAEAVPHSLFRSLAYLSYYYWGYLWGHFHIRKVRRERQLIVADRYFYDYFYQRTNMNLPHFLLRILSYLIPVPDLIVFLDADAHAIYERKNELTVEEIQRQQNVISEICEWLPNSVIVDTEKGIADTVDQVKVAVANRIAEMNK